MPIESLSVMVKITLLPQVIRKLYCSILQVPITGETSIQLLITLILIAFPI